MCLLIPPGQRKLGCPNVVPSTHLGDGSYCCLYSLGSSDAMRSAPNRVDSTTPVPPFMEPLPAPGPPGWGVRNQGKGGGRESGISDKRGTTGVLQ